MDAAVMEAPGVAPTNLSDSGSWLCSQDETLRSLVQRIGAWDDGRPAMHYVRDVVMTHDAGLAGWPSESVRKLGRMMPDEVARLRMLASLAPVTHDDKRVQFSVRDLESFSRTDEGRRLVELYLRAVRIGVLG